MDAVERYWTDAIYRSLVFMMKKMVKDGSVTGNELIEAAELARDLSEEEAASDYQPDCQALRERSKRFFMEGRRRKDARRQLNRRFLHGALALRLRETDDIKKTKIQIQEVEGG